MARKWGEAGELVKCFSSKVKWSHRVGDNRKRYPESTNADQKLLETEFLIVICRHTGNKWQSKTLFLSIFDPRSSILDSVFDCRRHGVMILA